MKNGLMKGESELNWF